MTLSSTKLVPELQYYFEKFIRFSIINKSQIPAPVTIEDTYIPEQSFIELLFNDDYPYTSYKYHYTESPSRSTIPLEYLDRIMLYPASGKYMELDDTGENLFLLQSNDFTMLDALLSYRIDSTSLTMIDTTGIISFDSTSFDSTSFTIINTTIDTTGAIYFDSTSVILYADFDSFTTSLSKLIYLYLDLKIRGSTSNYNNITLVSNGDLLSSCYEAYVLDEFYKIISARGI